jgi:hypothetical protein
MIKDNIVEAVRQDLLERSQTGIRKYNTTLDRTDLSLRDWLQHAYEECLDQANYLKRSIIELDNSVAKHEQSNLILEAKILMFRDEVYKQDKIISKEDFDKFFGITTQRLGIIVKNDL